MHYLADLLFVILRFMYILSHQTSTDLSLYKSKSILLYDYNFLKFTVKILPTITEYLPAERCDTLMN